MHEINKPPIEDVVSLLVETMRVNKIDVNLAIASMLQFAAECSILNGFPHEKFKKMIDECVEEFKAEWPIG